MLRRSSRAGVASRAVAVIGAVLVIVSISAAWGLSPSAPKNFWLTSSTIRLPQPPRTTPLVIEPLYNDDTVVTDQELATVLKQVQPRFPAKHLKPNFVEHALRTWSVKARFRDPNVMSGEAMADFLMDHGKYIASWGDDTKPLMSEQDTGVAIRWGKDYCASVHHDHWLACLTEAGVDLNAPIYVPGNRQRTIHDALNYAMAEFRVDEVEVEWSAMAFGLWISPQKGWTNREGRSVTFDLLVDRLVRGDQKFGVCAGTHRVYAIMLLVRLDDEYHILSEKARKKAWEHLEFVRDQITVSQFPDGYWASDWSAGKSSVEHPVEEELYKRVIATGHHLEWLAIAPKELHPPHEQIRKAARWIIDTTVRQSPDDILKSYTFFSHVGNALALWRGTHPHLFFEAWEANLPADAFPAKATVSTDQPSKSDTAADAH